MEVQEDDMEVQEEAVRSEGSFSQKNVAPERIEAHGTVQVGSPYFI